MKKAENKTGQQSSGEVKEISKKIINIWTVPNDNDFGSMLVSKTTIGTRIGVSRVAKNMTQTELANKIGTVYQRVHEWECDWRNPSDKYLVKIADVLDVDFNWLKNGAYYDEPYNLYQEYSIDNDLISDDAFEQRKNDLKSSAELLPVLSSETLSRVATLLRYLYFHDLIDAYPDFIDSADYLGFKTILEGESLKDTIEYIVNKIERNCSD